MQFDAQRRYRMPVGFGPSPGPRQRLDGGSYDGSSTRRTNFAVSFLTEAAALEPLLPPGFSLDGEPVVTVELSRLTGLQWLAGRGYSLMGVKFPARYEGARDKARGPYLAVLWENLADPIITGREELGFAKLYAELPETRLLDGEHHLSAAWLGHTFMTMKIGNLQERTAGAPGGGRVDGILHYKYMPRTGVPGEQDVGYAALSPPMPHLSTVDTSSRGSGEVAFLHSTWEQLPTLCHIVNTLAALPQIEPRGAVVTTMRGGSDLSEQRALA